MRNRNRFARAMSALAIATFTTAPMPALAHGPQPVDTATPIQHVVVIFQENVSFDHYFATYPVAQNPSGEPQFSAAEQTPDVNGLSGILLSGNSNAANSANGANAINPFRLDRSQASTCDQDHNYGAEQTAFDMGLMDAFPLSTGTGASSYCAAGYAYGKDKGVVMGYFDGNTVTAIWNYAQTLRDERQFLWHHIRAFHSRRAQPGRGQHLSRDDERHFSEAGQRQRRTGNPGRRPRSDRRRVLQRNHRRARRQQYRRSAQCARRHLGRVHGRVRPDHQESRRQHRMQSAKPRDSRQRRSDAGLHTASRVVPVFRFDRQPHSRAANASRRACTAPAPIR